VARVHGMHINAADLGNLPLRRGARREL
jgi:hypothetical protein